MSTMGYVTTLTGAEDAASVNFDFEKQNYKAMENGKLVSKNFSDVISFQRSTVGGRWNEKGEYEMVPVNMPRFDYDPITKVLKGLLVEEQRTNLSANSQLASFNSLSGGAYIKLTGLNHAGMQYGAAIPAGAVAGTSWAYSLAFTAAVVGTVYAMSLFFRYDDGRAPVFGAPTSLNSTLNAFALVHDGAPQLPNTYTVTHVGGGLYRASVITTAQATGARGWGIIKYPNQGAGTPEMIVTGVQIEAAAPVTTYIPSQWTFNSRATAATYYDKSGVLQTAAVNVARSNAYSYIGGNLKSIGLLVEDAATNLAFPSNDLNTLISVARASYVPSKEWFVDGKSMLYKLFEDNTSGTHFGLPNLFTVQPDTTYTMSWFIKAAGRTKARFEAQSTGLWGNGGPSVVVDLVAKTVTPFNCTAEIVPMANGVFRVSMTKKSTAATTFTSNMYPTLVNDAGENTYLGDGVSGIYVGGYQVEVGGKMTSYIPTPNTFTSRSTAATYYDAAGLIQTAGVNVARSNAYGFDVNGRAKPIGLLLEKAATNLLLNSANPSVWTGAVTGGTTTRTPNASAGPRGDATMTRIERTNLVAWYMSAGFSAGNGVPVTASFYAKAGVTGNILSTRIQASVYANRCDVVFNLATGVVVFAQPTGLVNSVVASMEPVGGGVYRCSLTAYPDAAIACSTAYATPMDATRQIDSAPLVTCDIYLDAGQIEVGTLPTSYIDTTTTTVTRAADVYASAQVTRAADVFASVATTRTFDNAWVADVTPWYNVLEGTTDVTFTPGGIGTGGTTLAFYMRSATDAAKDIIATRRDTSGNILGLVTDSGGVTQAAIIGLASSTIDTRYRCAMALKKDSFAFSVNGRPSVIDNAGNMPTPKQLNFGNNGNNSQNTNGYINSFRYYPVRLSNSQIEILSA